MLTVRVTWIISVVQSRAICLLLIDNLFAKSKCELTSSPLSNFEYSVFFAAQLKEKV